MSLESARGSFVAKHRRSNMGFAVRLILYFYQCLYLVSCLFLSVLHPFVGEGDLVCPSSVYQAGGGFNTSSQVAMYLVAGVLTGVGCGY